MKKDIHCGYHTKEGRTAELKEFSFDMGRISNGQDILVALWMKCDVADKEHTVALTPMTARTMAANLLVLANDIEKEQYNVRRTNEAADPSSEYGGDWKESES